MDKGIFFEITNACNHNCIHCCKNWEDNSEKRTADKAVLDKILAFPKRHLTISGGEPSLVKDKVMYLVEREKTKVIINTNMTNWTKEDITYLVGHGVEFNVSVVSLDRTAYKKITRADTYDMMFETLQEIPKNSFITIVVNRLNRNTIDYTVAVLILMGFTNIMVTPQKPTQDEHVDVDEISRYAEKLHERYKNVANIMTQGYCNVKFCDHLCNAGIGRFVIDTKQNVYPCAPIHKECLLGTIDTPFAELEENGRRFYLSYPEEQRHACKGFML